MSLTDSLTNVAAEAKPTPSPLAGERRLASCSTRAIMLGPASGALLYLCFPPVERAFLAWVALVPLLALSAASVKPGFAYISAWLGGLVFWVASLVWMWELHPAAWLPWIAMAVFQACYWPFFLFLTRSARHRLRLPLVVIAPVAWVTCEYLQAYALSGFPWYYLAHSQFRFVQVIQVSDLAGAWAVSALVVVVNSALCEVWTFVRNARGADRRWWASRTVIGSVVGALALFGGALAYGQFKIATSRFDRGPRVLLLQSNMRQEMKMTLDHDQIVNMFADLIRGAFAGDARDGVDLVVWPETSYPPGWTTIDGSAGVAALERAAQQIQNDSSLLGWFNRRTESTAELNAWSRELRCPMLVGLPTYDLNAQGGFKANGAAWIDGSDAPPLIYRKMHLVPFGEYIPLMEHIPWIKRLAPYDDDRMPRLRPGASPIWFDHGNLRYAAAICFEDTLPHLVRRFFSEAPAGRQPDALVNMSNDGWFNGSAEHDMHLAIGVFRSVENRAPLIRVANMGYTAVVDGNGQIVRSLAKKTSGSLTAEVPLDPRTSVYSRFGDWLPQLCAGLSALVVMALPFVRR